MNCGIFRFLPKTAAAGTAISLFWLLMAAVPPVHSAELGVKFLAGWAHAGVNAQRVPSINRIAFGAGFEAWLIRWIGLEVDAFFTVKGYRVEWEDREHDFAEISFPVLLKARVFLDRAATLSLSAFGGGAYSRFLTEMDPNFERYDFGIIAGGSIEKRLGRIGFILEGRYHWGLRYQSDEYLPSRFSFKTRTLYLLTGANLHF